MDSWFGKLREKIIVDKVQAPDENADSDDERKRKEEQLKDTLRKLNTDEVLNDDDIARVSESVRKVKKVEPDESRGQTSSTIADMAKTTILSKPAAEEEQHEVTGQSEAVKSRANVFDDDETFESSFFD